MTEAAIIDDPSTYKRRFFNSLPSGNPDPENKGYPYEAIQLKAVSASYSNWTTVIINFSVLDRVIFTHNADQLSQTIPHPVPLPFHKSYREMQANRELEDGWDGVHSVGISRQAVDIALRFLAALPADVTPPEASASGDGTVDWYWRNGRNAATVTFFPNGRVSYFSMTESGRVKDSFKFSGSIPIDLLDSLQQF